MSIGEDVTEFRRLIENSKVLNAKIMELIIQIELTGERMLDTVKGDIVGITTDRENELEAMEKELKDKTGKERATLEHRINVKKQHLNILKENKNNL